MLGVASSAWCCAVRAGRTVVEASRAPGKGTKFSADGHNLLFRSLGV